MLFFGIDISKSTLDITVLVENKTCHKKFKNTEAGFEEFHQFIKSSNTPSCFCMEAAGIYGIY